MSIEVIAFDVDGTLADTEEVHRQAFNMAFAHAGLGWVWDRPTYRALLKITGGKERIRAYIGTLALNVGEKQRLHEQVPKLHAAKTQHYTEVVRGGRMPLRTGVERLLREAKGAGVRLAIATTTTAANVDALLQATLGPGGLDLFDVIACGDQVREKKPAPDIYELVLRTLGVGPDAAIAIEDSVNGLRAARGAGLWTLVTPTVWTEQDDFSGAGLVLPSLGDPSEPLAGEPGRLLEGAAWLSLEELMGRARPVRPLNAVQKLYREVC